MRRLGIGLLLVGCLAACGDGEAQGVAERADSERSDLLAVVGGIARASQTDLASELDAAVVAVRQGRAGSLGELGRLLDAHGYFEAAREAYGLALVEASDDPRLVFLLARAQYETGAVEQAVETLERAVALAPERAPGHWRAGLWLAELGRFEAAEAAFHRAAELDPDDPSATFGHARLLIEDGRPSEALALLEDRRLAGTAHGAHLADRARRAAGQATGPPGAVVAPHHWADPWIDELEELRVGLGEDLAAVLDAIRDGRTEVALAALAELLEDRPDDVTIQGLYAAAVARDGRPEDAVALLRAAAARQPRHYRIALNLSLNLAAAGRGEEALEQARRAVALHPGHASARYQHGRCAERLGSDDEARDAYSAALRLGFPAERVVPRLQALDTDGAPR